MKHYPRYAVRSGFVGLQSLAKSALAPNPHGAHLSARTMAPRIYAIQRLRIFVSAEKDVERRFRDPSLLEERLYQRSPSLSRVPSTKSHLVYSGKTGTGQRTLINFAIRATRRSSRQWHSETERNGREHASERRRSATCSRPITGLSEAAEQVAQVTPIRWIANERPLACACARSPVTGVTVAGSSPISRSLYTPRVCLYGAKIDTYP